MLMYGKNHYNIVKLISLQLKKINEKKNLQGVGERTYNTICKNEKRI